MGLVSFCHGVSHFLLIEITLEVYNITLAYANSTSLEMDSKGIALEGVRLLYK